MCPRRSNIEGLLLELGLSSTTYCLRGQECAQHVSLFQLMSWYARAGFAISLVPNKTAVRHVHADAQLLVGVYVIQRG